VSGLAAPTGTLVHIALGIGYQNYTCTTDPTATPVQVGAVATLYDVGQMAAQQPALTEALQKVVYGIEGTLGVPFAQGTENLMSAGNPLGVHYFRADGTPTFDLRTSSHSDGIIYASKVQAVTAPAASAGAPTTGLNTPVPWLRLVAKTGYVLDSVDLAEVYRVSTFGGNPPLTCKGYTTAKTQNIQVYYNALYYFYD
jgi:hypothetical protein